MQKILGIIAVITLLLLFTLPASAHVLKVDGSIGAVMHVNPEDDPIVGQESSFFFEFKDKNNQFKSANCECQFAIVQNGKELFTQNLFQNNSDSSLTSANVSYTFPSKGVYTVKVNGKPLSDSAFNPFTLTYTLRIERTLSDNASTTRANWFITYMPYLTGGLVGFSILGFVFLRGRSKK